jgi:hypothetical protein
VAKAASCNVLRTRRGRKRKEQKMTRPGQASVKETTARVMTTKTGLRTTAAERYSVVQTVPESATAEPYGSWRARFLDADYTSSFIE